MIKKTPLFLLTSVLLSTTSLMATDLKPMIQIGYDFAGETLATVEEYDYYNGYETSKIRAGQGLSLEVGAVIENNTKDFEAQFLVGYKSDDESTNNGSVSWDRIPFTALAMLKNNRWKIGGGVTYHLNPKLNGSFSGYDNNGKYFNDSVDDSYENALGGIVQVQYQMSNNIAFGLKGTFIEYKLKSNPSIVANGNSIGLNFSYAFGERSEFR